MAAGLSTLMAARAAAASNRERQQRPLVVLDAGHGGRDSGAVGPTGLLEKDVTLDVALQLRELLEKGDGCDVLLTRDNDRFVPLAERVQMAQTNRAHLLLSLHADALSDPTIRGASVYTLSPRASDPLAAEIAERENSDAAIGGREFEEYPPEVSVILESLMFREKRVFSVQMKRALIAALRQDVRLLTEPARQANFLILRSGSVPSALLEMGFISNRQDEGLLRSPGHRRTIAVAIADAVGKSVELFTAGG